MATPATGARNEDDPAGPGFRRGREGVRWGGERRRVGQAVATFQPSSPAPEKNQRRIVSLTIGRTVASRP
jgi:hypothetical protein